MKKIFYLFACLILTLSSCAQDENETTFYLIRHSEKNRTDATNKNPSLNNDGKKRAQNWSDYFKNIDLDAVYATNYNRTKETATPTATSKNLEITTYNPFKIDANQLKKDYQGKKVLIVGHSNTTPMLANKLLGENKFADLSDTDNETIFIITINKENTTSKVEKVEVD